MKILFIQGGSRLKLSNDGKWYTDGNFTEEVWDRYRRLADSLTIVLRREPQVYDKEIAEKKFNAVPCGDNVNVIALPDVTNPKLNMINPIFKHKVKKTIRQAVLAADKIIIRSMSFYTLIAYKACIECGKPYLMEVTGFCKEGLSYHSTIGKLIANSWEKKMKRMVYNANCAIYVTEDALQKRYPCKGEMLGCSDVQLPEFDDNILVKRLEKIKNGNKTIKIGTAAFLDVKWKGQELVIRALASLKEKGYTNFVYEMIGLGAGDRLKELSIQLGVADHVKILGAKNHSEVAQWLDGLDVYVQSSYQEGLCRSIVEAMSRALPVVCSNTGGNYELVENKYLFPCGDSEQLVNRLLLISNELENAATRNYLHSKHYSKDALETKRNDFFCKFITGK